MSQQDQSGKFTAGAVSIFGLALVWGAVWANLPPKGEFLTAPPTQIRSAGAESVPPELDLTIPGVPTIPQSGESPQAGGAGPVTVSPMEGKQSNAPIVVERFGDSANAADARARQVTEIKCEAEIQQVCPESLTGDDRRQCVEVRLKQVSASCRQTIRRRLVRWTEIHQSQAACLEDVNRYCRDVQPGDGRLVQCLQDHAQSVSDRCYQTLPKGKLLYKN
jgi:hypothetical protein